MLLPRRVRSVMAAPLVALLLVLSTGVPSHHHEPDHEPIDAPVLGPDHHSHGTILVDQGNRAPSPGPEFNPAGVPAELEVFDDVLVVPGSEEAIKPRGRSPPPNHSPRAPPLLS